jgi:hypothetical protein
LVTTSKVRGVAAGAGVGGLSVCARSATLVEKMRSNEAMGIALRISGVLIIC